MQFCIAAFKQNGSAGAGMSHQVMTKLAVLMSIYRNDRPDCVRNALDSVFAQDPGVGAEVRLYLGIDGEIPDELEGVLSQYADRLYRISRSTINHGLGVTLNRLLDLLEDESYVFRMDADDICLPDRFRKQLTYMRSNPECGVLGGAIIEFDESGQFPDRSVRYPESFPEPIKWFSKRSPVAHPTVCIRREVFNIVGGYPPLKFNEDIALWFRCINHGIRFNNLVDPVLRYRVDSGFFSRRSVPKAFEEFKVYTLGIYRSVGLSPYLVFPWLRLIFRLLPRFLARYAYAVRAVKP